jgi:starch synthase (maltosyl-transferring)
MPAERFPLGRYTLTVDTATGGLIGLHLDEGPDALGAANGAALLGAALAHSPLEAEARYETHHTDENSLTITARLGPLRVHTRYVEAGGLIERSVTVENASGEQIQLTGVRLGLGGVQIGGAADCRFEAPANVIRPRLPLRAAIEGPIPPVGRPARPGMAFAPGQEHRFGQAFGNAPDVGPGLIIVHNAALEWSLLTWYVSDVEAATPWAGGRDKRLMLGFDIGLAGWLPPGGVLADGEQYLMLHQGDYQSALAAYRRTFEHTGILPPIYGPVDRALDWTGVYEVHPGQYGGFDGLRGALPAIQRLGVDTLYLLPVYAHRNKRNLPWDENWDASGSPYAIHDFRRLEPSLGSEEAFARLVEQAHRLGMRVLMDLVLQGSSLEARYVNEHPDWYARNEDGDLVHSHGWNDTWSFDWANPDYQQFVVDYALEYIRRFDVDGFRVDAPHGKEPNWDRGLPYHASATNLGTSALLERLRREMLAVKPGAALYCELFGPLWVRSHEISNDYHVYAMALQLFERRLTPYEFGEYLRDYWAVMPHSAEGQPTPRICFTETHDTRSWPSYALRSSAVEQALLGILVMAGFVPMIWAGQEERQRAFIRRLLLARQGSHALRRGDALFNAVAIDDEGHYRVTQGDRPADHVFALIRRAGDEVLLGVASLLPEQATFRLGLPVDRLPLDPDRHYRLRDLIGGVGWTEYGKDTWTGSELASFRISPRMYQPYIFRLEAAD